jgi:hypothetical protein
MVDESLFLILVAAGSVGLLLSLNWANTCILKELQIADCINSPWAIGELLLSR